MKCIEAKIVVLGAQGECFNQISLFSFVFWETLARFLCGCVIENMWITEWNILIESAEFQDHGRRFTSRLRCGKSEISSFSTKSLQASAVDKLIATHTFACGMWFIGFYYSKKSLIVVAVAFWWAAQLRVWGNSAIAKCCLCFSNFFSWLSGWQQEYQFQSNLLRNVNKSINLQSSSSFIGLTDLWFLSER